MDGGVRPLAERRRAVRLKREAEHGVVQSRIRPGHEAVLIDIGAGGALIETCMRLLPGRPVELQFERGEQPATIRGRVLRCGVARVQPSRVAYRAAVSFEQPLPWLSVPASGC